MSRYLQLEFLRMDPRFRALQSNEKLVARQEFLTALEATQRKSPTLVYSLVGLNADCDALFARSADDIEAFQEASSRLRGAGLGRYLAPVRVLLAPGAGAPAGRARYLVVRAPPVALSEIDDPAAFIGEPAGSSWLCVRKEAHDLADTLE